MPGAELRVTGRLDAGNDHQLREELHRAIVLGEGELEGRTLVIVDPSDRFERVVAAMRLGKVLQRRRRATSAPVSTVTVGRPPAQG